MAHDAISLHTENARSAAELAARLQSAAAEEGLQVTADGRTVTIAFGNPVLAGIVSGLCRGITGLANALPALLGGRGHGAGLPSRP